MAVVAASNSTHFLFNGVPYPKGWEVVGFSTNAAVLKREDFRDLYVSPVSTVGGVVPANQAALVAALEAIVDGPGVEDMASAVDIGTEVNKGGASVNAVRVAVGTSSGVLIAARATRRTLAISNPSSNTATVAISTGTAVLATSANLEPGDSIELATTAAFNAIASAACSVDVVETY